MKIISIAGIPIRIHFTFVLLLLWISITSPEGEFGKSTLLILGIFVCLLLHELGHALTAKRFGIRTRDITLYPIGGIATLMDRPKPKQEFWIALAGPAVNVLIALLLWPAVLLSDGQLPPLTAQFGSGSFLSELMIANIILPAFNMIPAFPMDGGRVLRAILGMNMSEARATQIAGRIGQTLALLGFAIAILLGQVFIMLIAVFVLLGASQEMSASIGQSLLQGHHVSEAMLTQFVKVSHNDAISDVARLLIAGSQHDFPVLFGNDVLGVLRRQDIVQGLGAPPENQNAATFVCRNAGRVSPNDDLESAIAIFSNTDNCPIIVLDQGQLVGMLTVENLGEFMLLEQAKAR